MEDLVDIHKAFFKPNPAKPLFSRTSAVQVGRTPHDVTWQTQRVPGALARARGERQTVGGLNRFVTGHNPKGWEMERGVNEGIRQAKAGAARRKGRTLRPVASSTPRPQSPATQIPDWLR